MTPVLPPPPPPRTVAVVAGEARSLVRFRGRLLEAMIARGHRVHTIAPGDPPPELLALGVRHHRWDMHRTGARPWQEVRAIARLTGILRGIAPDAVLSYSTKAMVWGALAAAVARVPNIYTMVTGLGYLFQPPAPEEDLRARARRLVLAMVTRSWFRLAFAQTRAVLVQNADDAAELRRLHVLPVGHRVVRIAGSGIDLEHYGAHPVPREGPPVFLFVGRLLRDKGLGEFVAAARRLRQRYGGAVRCVVLGPLDVNPSQIGRAELDAWVAEGVIEYAGEVDDVRPWLRACTAFVLPSYREGVPRSGLEAMAVGRAILTTDAPGCRETVEPEGNGVLVPVRDAEALAAAMARVVERPELAASWGRRSRALAEAVFDVHMVNAEILAAMAL